MAKYQYCNICEMETRQPNGVCADCVESVKNGNLSIDYHKSIREVATGVIKAIFPTDNTPVSKRFRYVFKHPNLKGKWAQSDNNPNEKSIIITHE